MPIMKQYKGKHGRVHQQGELHGLVGEIVELYRDDKYSSRDMVTMNLIGHGQQKFKLSDVELLDDVDDSPVS